MPVTVNIHPRATFSINNVRGESIPLPASIEIHKAGEFGDVKIKKFNPVEKSCVLTKKKPVN